MSKINSISYQIKYICESNVLRKMILCSWARIRQSSARNFVLRKLSLLLISVDQLDLGHFRPCLQHQRSCRQAQISRFKVERSGHLHLYLAAFGLAGVGVGIGVVGVVGSEGFLALLSLYIMSEISNLIEMQMTRTR